MKRFPTPGIEFRNLNIHLRHIKLTEEVVSGNVVRKI